MTSISRLEEHGIPVTAAGSLETSTVVYNVDQLRSLLDTGADAEGRAAHFAALFDGIAPAAAAAPGTPGGDGGASLAARISAHVIGNAELSDEDRAAIAPAFPLTVHVSAATDPVVISTPKDLSTPDGRPAIVTYTDLVLDQGGYFICKNTPLLFTCTTLTRHGNTGTSAADFNILGVDGDTPPTPATPPPASQAATGYNGECSSAGISGRGGGTGNPGSPGTPGTGGGAGGNGTASQQATIRILETLTATTITVFAQSGTGGRGGNGGQGGPGQQGGNGGNGVTCGCTGNSGGPGGDGGSGGPGGPAGPGGNAADPQGNVQVQVPLPGDVAKISPAPAQAPPGAAGTPGPGGTPGSGGSGGSKGKDNNAGGNGGSGNYGPAGAQAQAGTLTGKAPVISVTTV
jgi:hypothetical protein